LLLLLLLLLMMMMMNNVVKVKLSLCLTKYHTVKAHGGVEVQLYAFLTSTLDAGEWSALRPSRFNSGK